MGTLAKPNNECKIMMALRIYKPNELECHNELVGLQREINFPLEFCGSITASGTFGSGTRVGGEGNAD